MDQEKMLEVGGVELHIEHRTLSDDGGPALRVLGEVDGRSAELLRFDCFCKDPHYHFDPSGKDDKRDLHVNEVPDSIAWTLEQLRCHLVEMIREAGYENVASRVDQAAVASVLPDVESFMRR